MHILSIGSDRELFTEGSAVLNRARSYAGLFDRLDTIVFSKKGFQEKEITENARIIPTNSSSRWLYIPDALRLGKAMHKPDWVTTQDPFESGWVGMKLAGFFGVPLLVQVHTDVTSPYFKKSSLLNRVRLCMAPRVLRRAARIRVVSKKIKEGIIQKYNISPEKIIVLPVFSEIFSVEEKQKRGTHFLAVSRLTYEKNIPLLLTAFAFFCKKHPEASLTIVGDGPEKKNLIWLSKKLGVQEKVSFLGWVNQTREYFQNADFFLQSSRYEGYGLTFVEAAAYHLPIISTNVGIAQDVGAYIAQHNSKDFTEKMEEAFRERRTATLKNLSLPNTFSDYLTLYKKSFSLL